MIILSTEKYKYLADKIVLASRGKHVLGNFEQKYFGDKERYLRVAEIDSMKGQDIALIGGTISDEDTLILYDLAHSLISNGIGSLNLIIPYFGYSTMERATRAGEVVTAKTRATLFSSLPVAHRGNSIVLIDLHTDGITYYFERNITPVHLYVRDEIINIVNGIKTEREKVIACTDAGRAKWVESLANQLDLNAAFVFKKRIGSDQVQISGVNADVKGMTVIIYDDMIRSGGSLIQAAQAYKDAGAKEIYAITTHGIFSSDAVGRLEKSNLFKSIYSSDTYPSSNKSKLIKYFSVANLISNYLTNVARVSK